MLNMGIQETVNTDRCVCVWGGRGGVQLPADWPSAVGRTSITVFATNGTLHPDPWLCNDSQGNT